MHGEDQSNSERRSIDYDLRRAAREDAELGRLLDWSSVMYPRMLIEDVSNRVMPYHSYRNRSTGVILEPNDGEVEKLVASALGRNRDLAGAVYEFGRWCLSNVVLFGEDAYEIVYEAQTDRLGKRRFSFARISPCSLKRRDKHTAIQRVPRLIAKELGIPRSIPLQADRLVIFEAPPRIRKKLPQILERLAALSGHTLPDFAVESFRPGTKRSPFDLKVFSRSKDLAIAAAGREIGWSGRAIFLYGEQRVVEHYWWYREFAFERFLIELRDEFLSTLNDGLRRAGAKCGFEGQIHLEGMPTLKEVDEAQQHLLAGDRSLTEINSAFRRGWDD